MGVNGTPPLNWVALKIQTGLIHPSRARADLTSAASSRGPGEIRGHWSRFPAPGSGPLADRVSHGRTAETQLGQLKRPPARPKKPQIWLLSQSRSVPLAFEGRSLARGCLKGLNVDCVPRMLVQALRKEACAFGTSVAWGTWVLRHFQGGNTLCGRPCISETNQNCLQMHVDLDSGV